MIMRRAFLKCVTGAIALWLVASAGLDRPHVVSAQDAGFDLARLSRIDAVVNDAIADKKLPGAVVLVGRGDAIVFRKAYGHRALVPAAEPMTLDTIFDLASLTKVVATTPAVM